MSTKGKYTLSTKRITGERNPAYSKRIRSFKSDKLEAFFSAFHKHFQHR